MKLANRFIILALGLVFALPTQALPTLEKGELASILPNMQMLFDSEQNLSVFVRVVRIAGDGECQEPSEACERDNLYVVISDNEREPVASATYHLDKAHEWTMRSVSACSGPADDLCARIVLDQTLLNQAGKAWETVRHVYEFRMDSVKEIGAGK